MRMPKSKPPFAEQFADSLDKFTDGRGFGAEDKKRMDLVNAAPELLRELKQGLRLLQSIERETGYVTFATQLSWQGLIARAESGDS